MTLMQALRDGPRRSLPNVLVAWVYFTAIAMMFVKLWHDQYDRATYFLVLVMWMDSRLRARIRIRSAS